jgi:GTPase SAR1 family protein
MTTLATLRDLILAPRTEVIRNASSAARFDELAQHVFRADLSDEAALRTWYLNSGTSDAFREATGVFLETGSGDPFSGSYGALGDFEQIYLSKIIRGEQRVIVVTGPLGCGKTLTLEYLRKEKHLQTFGHCNRTGCDRVRTVLVLSFDAEPFVDSQGDPAAAREAVVDYVLTAMREKVDSAAGFSQELELSEFWDSEIALSRRSDHPSLVFAKIHLAAEATMLATGKKELTIAEKIRIRDTVLQDTRQRTEYVARLWNHAFRRKSGGQARCQILFFDNLDHAEPAVQATLLSLMMTLAKYDETVVVGHFRPETWEQRGHNNRLYDHLVHSGPSPIDVYVQRLARFAVYKEEYWHEGGPITRDEFDGVARYCAGILRILLADRNYRLAPLIEALSGRDVRNALALGENLVRAAGVLWQRDVADSEADLTAYLMTGGHAYFRSTSNGFIQNIFVTTDPTGWRYPLIKLRILQIVRNGPGARQTLAYLQHFLTGFGYDDPAIAAALNDLLSKYKQLLRSDGRSIYTVEQLTADSGQHRLTLTEIGHGYLENACGMLGYLEHMMFEARVEAAAIRTPRLDGNLVERLGVLAGFLRFLLDKDNEETRRAVSSLGLDEVRQEFGSGIVTQRIIQRCADSARGILRKIGDQERSAIKADTERVQAYYDNLYAEAERINARFLYSPPDPSS